ncbi:MAG: single-stranded DNA-binding protein [Desulfamplus sp.]|nr:single-stranded DNA-binding protein [Desulfamplus sp.]
MNKVILTGNIGTDVKIYGEEKSLVARCTLATDEWNGETTETVWHSLVGFGKIAEQAKQVFHKGTRVLVIGRLRYSEYEGKQQTDIVVQEIEVQKFSESAIAKSDNQK